MIRKLDSLETWNPMVEDALRAIGFYHVSKIGVIRGFYPLLSTLAERWRPKTHTFVFLVGEVTVTLEDFANIFGLPIDGQVVSEAEPFDILESIQRYVRCQVFFLLGSTLFADKSMTYAHAKALCHASRYDTKKMDDPLNLLWSHSKRTAAWLSKTTTTFRQEIDYMKEVNGFALCVLISNINIRVLIF
ncbi:hypothetical protein AHAS_Ahas11G0221800 [Arachis hypogaea]